MTTHEMNRLIDLSTFSHAILDVLEILTVEEIAEAQREAEALIAPELESLRAGIVSFGGL